MTERVITSKTTTAGSGRVASTKVVTTVSSDALDPLSMLAASPPPAPVSNPLMDDPLSAPTPPKAVDKSPTPLTPPSSSSAAAAAPSTKASASTVVEETNQTRNLWDNRKAQLKKDFTVTGKIKVSNLTWNAEEGTGVEDGTSVRRVDKYDKRLASLERRQMKDTERVEVSQAEVGTLPPLHWKGF